MSFNNRMNKNPGGVTILPGLIVVEGIDGAGTTTQSRLLVERLRAVGSPVFDTSEPTQNPIGQLLRDVLAGRVRVTPEAVAYLFAADRWEHVFGEGGIVQHHDAGEIVVCDRYAYSSLAYQTVECEPGLVVQLNQHFPTPGLVIFLDLAPDIGERRLAARTHREIYEQAPIQAKVRENYHRLLEAADRTTTVVTLSGADDEAAIHRKIWEAVESASILEP